MKLIVRAVLVQVSLGVTLVLVLAVEAALATLGPRPPDAPDIGRARPVDPGAARVVWLGDSTAAGVGVVEADETLPIQVAGTVAARVEVLARSGARVSDVVADQLPRLDGASDVIFVSVGANDVTHLTSRRDFESRYADLLAGLPESADVVLLGIPDMGSIPRLAQPLRYVAGARGSELDEVVADLAERTGATYVDIAGFTGPAFRADPDRNFSTDNYHPSAEGYALWADAVSRARRSRQSGG